MNRPDPDTESKVRASIRLLNETIQQNANEPSLALYRIQVNTKTMKLFFCKKKNVFLIKEHVQKTLPSMIQKRNELENLQEQMNGLVFDIEYGVEGIKALGTSAEHVIVNYYIL